MSGCAKAASREDRENLVILHLARKNGMLLMGCDQCCIEREIDKKLVDGAVIGCFPNLYAALSGNMPDQVITL